MKKYICILVSCILLAAACPVLAFSDTAGTKYESAVSVLTGLGIVEGTGEDTFEPQRSLTRAELVTIVLRLLKMDGQSADAAVFTDVAESHWAYGNIGTAYQMGIVNGISETEFAPDAEVTYPQGVKMLVRALGYGVQAEASGGYPSGYLVWAARLDLLKGTSDNGGALLRGEMAQLVYNALETELSENASYGSDELRFQTNGNTVLSTYHKISVMHGYVGATKDAELEIPARPLSETEVLLFDNGGEMCIADVGETAAAEMLGVPGTFYVKDNGDETFTILAAVQKNSADVLYLTAPKVLSADAASISYEGETANTQYKVSFANPTVVFNGSVKMDWTPSLLKPDTGSVTVITGGTKDIIIVESYDSFVVNSANEETMLVTFKNGDAITLDTEDKQASSNAELADFEEWGILSVAKGAKKTKYVYTKEMLTGKVTELSETDAVIGGVAYPVSPDLYGDLTIGLDCAYYLDYTGSVVAADSRYAPTYKYGILVNAEVSKGLDGKAQFKIYTQDGEMQVYTAKERMQFLDYAEKTTPVTVDAASLISGEAQNSIYADGKTKRQLIRYELSENEELAKIETAADYTYRINDESRYNVFSWDSLTNKSRQAVTSAGELYPDGIGGVFIGKDYSTFSGWAAPRANTKIFVLPEEGAEDKAYAMKGYKNLSHNNDGERYSNMRFYDTNEDCIIGAMVWETGSGEQTIAYPDNATDYAVVTKISKVLTEDGESATRLQLVNWKKYTEFTMDTQDDFECLYKAANANIYEDPAWYTSKEDGTVLRTIPEDGKDRAAMFMEAGDLCIGDIFQYEMNSAGEPKMISVVYRADYPGEYESTQAEKINFATKTSHYLSGVSHLTVKKVTDEGYVCEAKLAQKPGKLTGEVAKRFISAAPSKVLFIDKEKETHWVGFKEEVKEEDTLIRITLTYSSYMLVVIR